MKLLTKVVKFFFSGYFNFIASLAGIIGLLIVAFSQRDTAIIALVSIIIFLIIILIRVFFVLKTFILQKTEKGFHKFATYVRYSTEDGNEIIYELHKYIQCKTFVMDQHVHEFWWTGTEEPRISSLLQDYQQYVKTPKGELDQAIFRFKKPLAYNEFSIVHIRMDLDDSNHRSEPYIEQAIKEQVQLINFRIELRYLDNNANAKVSKKRMGAAVSSYEAVASIPFDRQSKSYEYTVFNPEVGHYYRIEWNRNLPPVV